MFDDINRVDSTIFKPQQAAQKQAYQGNSRKRREGKNGTEQADDVLEGAAAENEKGPAETENPHNLDIQV